MILRTWYHHPVCGVLLCGLSGRGRLKWTERKPGQFTLIVLKIRQGSRIVDGDEAEMAICV